MFFECARSEGRIESVEDFQSERIVFWGCGIRRLGGISEENLRRAEILATRGPVTRSYLKLGDSVPMGDPALLIPALYRPTHRTPAGSVLVPHFSDERSDAELLELSGCARVLRPNIRNNKRNLLLFIDHLVSSEFVLAASLHAAIAAAAYNRPFAFWDSGNVDLPLKWKDFSELVSVPCQFVRTITEGEEFYRASVKPAYRPPRLWPLMAAAPFAIRPEALLRVLDYDLRIQGTADRSRNIDRCLRELRQGPPGKERLRDYSGPFAPKQGEISRLNGTDSEVNRLKTQLYSVETELSKLRDAVRRMDSLAVKRSNTISDLRTQLHQEKRVANELRTQNEESRFENRRLQSLLERTRSQLLALQQSRAFRYTRRIDNYRAGTVLTMHMSKYLLGAVVTGRIFRRDGIPSPLQAAKEAFTIAGAGIFDKEWYLQANGDVAAQGFDPLLHYIFYGAREGRDPHPLFDTDWYLNMNADVAESGLNPLAHYIAHGAHEGRDPGPHFDTKWYLKKNADISEVGLNPLAHYIWHGAYEGRDPNPSFDSDWYLDNNPDVAARGENPLVHYVLYGIHEGRTPRGSKAPTKPHSTRFSADERPRLLFIDSTYPRPDQDSGSIDTYNYLNIFQAFGYQVVFAADAEFTPPLGVLKSVAGMGVRCITAAESGSIDRFIEEEGETFSVAVLSRVHCGGRYYEKVRECSPQAKIIFNTVDLHGRREQREARLLGSLKAMNLALGTIERERYLTRQCDATIVVSRKEKQWLESEVPGARVVYLPLMRDCPGREKNFEQRSGICFIGSYKHSPNVDAAEYFLDSIWPSVHEQMPNCTCYIIGSNLPSHIMHRNDPNVEIVGHVANLRNWLENMRLSVAPLRYGAGAKGKVVTSLANGLPCVATRIAVEGMNLKDDRHIAVEHTPAAFADRIVRLYQDRDIWIRLSDEGHLYCTQEFSLSAGRGRLEQLFETLDLPACSNDRNKRVSQVLTHV